MRLFDVLKQGDRRHTGIDQMFHELYERVAALEEDVFKGKKPPGRRKPPKDKDGNNRVNQ